MTELTKVQWILFEQFSHFVPSDHTIFCQCANPRSFHNGDACDFSWHSNSQDSSPMWCGSSKIRLAKTSGVKKRKPKDPNFRSRIPYFVPSTVPTFSLPWRQKSSQSQAPFHQLRRICPPPFVLFLVFVIKTKRNLSVLPNTPIFPQLSTPLIEKTKLYASNIPWCDDDLSISLKSFISILVWTSRLPKCKTFRGYFLFMRKTRIKGELGVCNMRIPVY